MKHYGTPFGSHHYMYQCKRVKLVAFPADIPREDCVIPEPIDEHTMHNGTCIVCGFRFDEEGEDEFLCTCLSHWAWRSKPCDNC